VKTIKILVIFAFTIDGGFGCVVAVVREACSGIPLLSLSRSEAGAGDLMYPSEIDGGGRHLTSYYWPTIVEYFRDVRTKSYRAVSPPKA